MLISPNWTLKIHSFETLNYEKSFLALHDSQKAPMGPAAEAPASGGRGAVGGVTPGARRGARTRGAGDLVALVLGGDAPLKQAHIGEL